MVDHSKLLNEIDYNPSTGVFTRKVSAGNSKAGSVVGNLSKKGYLKAMVQGKYVKMHQLAWFYVHGRWPGSQLDHINRIKQDNRIENLRVSDTSANCLNQAGPRVNNRSGLQGVHRIPKTGRYRAACTVRGFKHDLGVFATAEEAHQAYVSFKSNHIPA